MHFGRKGHGKSPNFDLIKASCPAFDQKCKQCGKNCLYKDFCKGRKNPKKEESEDSKKTTASRNRVEIHRMEMTQTSGKVLGISENHKRSPKPSPSQTYQKKQL